MLLNGKSYLIPPLCMYVWGRCIEMACFKMRFKVAIIAKYVKGFNADPHAFPSCVSTMHDVGWKIICHKSVRVWF